MNAIKIEFEVGQVKIHLRIISKSPVVRNYLVSMTSLCGTIELLEEDLKINFYSHLVKIFISRTFISFGCKQ